MKSVIRLHDTLGLSGKERTGGKIYKGNFSFRGEFSYKGNCLPYLRRVPAVRVAFILRNVGRGTYYQLCRGKSLSPFLPRKGSGCAFRRYL